MFNPIKQLSIKTMVALQTADAASIKQSKFAAAVLPREKHQRVGAAIGAALSTALYAASIPSMAAAKGGTSGFVNVITTFTNFAILLVGGLSVLMAVFSGVMFVTSAGNHKMVKQAKDTIKFVVIGMALVAGMWVLREVIAKFANPNGNDQTGNLTKNVSDSAASQAAGKGSAAWK